jgi:hypothetical protein
MTLEEIQKLCPKAEDISMTVDGTVGMKVGTFGMAVNVYRDKGKQEIRNQVLKLYRDLLGMNRSLEEDQRKVERNAKA